MRQNPPCTVSNADDQQRAIAGLRGTFSALRALRGIADWHALAEAVPRELCAHTEIERSALFLVVDGAAIAESVCFGEDVGWADEFRATSRANPVPLDYLVFEAEVLRRRKAMIINDPIAHPKTFKPLVKLSKTASYMVAPLIPEDRVIGFLHADYHFSGRPPDERGLEILAAYSEGAAYVLDLVRTRRQLNEYGQRLEEAAGQLKAFSAEMAVGGVALPGSQLWSTLPEVRGRQPQSDAAMRALSPRELEVLECLATGATNRKIAASLVLSEETVKTHVKHILRKLSVSGRSQAVARYLGARSTETDEDEAHRQA